MSERRTVASPGQSGRAAVQRTPHLGWTVRRRSSRPSPARPWAAPGLRPTSQRVGPDLDQLLHLADAPGPSRLPLR